MTKMYRAGLFTIASIMSCPMNMNTTTPRMVFLIGSPRSGSTLLQRMLGAHSCVFGCPEPHIITPLAHLGYFHSVEKAPYDHLRGVEAIRDFVKQLPAGEQDYLDACRAYTDTLYSRRLQGTGAHYFLDKTPAYALVLDFLARLYPEARYVVLTRHPVAIFCSFANSFFDGDYRAANDYNPILSRYVPAIARFLAAPPAHCHHVRYEQLVKNPDGQMRRMLEFLGLEFEEAVVEYGSRPQQEKGLGDPVSVDRHSRPMTKSVARWARELAADEGKNRFVRDLVAGLDPQHLEVWGYPVADLFAPLDALDSAEVAAPRRPPLDRFQFQRKALLLLRRNIHHNAFGRMVKKVRFFCDVLLR